MATYALIHGAGDSGWYWHLVEPELRERGHEVVAPDLPCEDEAAGWPEYADTVVEAIGDRGELVVVAQSLGGFTAPLVADRVPTELIVLVAGMMPLPGETGTDWWENTGCNEAIRERGGLDDDPVAVYMHDVPRDLAAEAMERERDQAGTPMEQPWPLEAWPDVPTRYLLCTDDHFFPADWLRGVVRERLGIAPDEIDTGHTPALSRPEELADRLAGYAAQRS